MKALTIKQPWASLIIFGGKDIENRDWPAPRPMFGQRFAIHSSKGLDPEDVDDAIGTIRDSNIISRRVLEIACTIKPEQCGVILGTVRLAGCVLASLSPWYSGKCGFVLEDPKPLTEPIAIRGALGFWNVPPEIAARLH